MNIFQERSGLEKKFFLMCEPIIQEAGYRLYDLEYIPSQKLLRIFIQNPLTRTAHIDDCVKIDNALTPSFETETWIPDDVTLEVSSPGIYRHLLSLEHFRMSLGETLSVIVNSQLSEDQIKGAPKGIRGEKKFRGKLLNVTDENFTLEVKNFPLTLNYDQVKKVNLDPDLKSI